MSTGSSRKPTLLPAPKPPAEWPETGHHAEGSCPTSTVVGIGPQSKGQTIPHPALPEGGEHDARVALIQILKEVRDAFKE